MEGEYIRTFDSISDAVRFCNRIPTKGCVSIKQACSNFKYTAYGYKWRLVEINDNLERECRYNPLIVTHKYNRKNVKKSLSIYIGRRVLLKNFESAADVCRELGFVEYKRYSSCL